MTNLAKAFEAAAGGPIIAAVIGDDDRESYGQRDKHPLFGRLVSWDEARATIDYEYDNGYGGADCHAVYAWTEDRVLFVHEYDGATSIRFVPRDPSPCRPDFGGQSPALEALLARKP